jgi:hypothetical protein
MSNITINQIVGVGKSTKANTIEVTLSDGTVWEHNIKTDKWLKIYPTKEELVESFNKSNG